MSRDWTPEELDQASEIMKASGHLSREEFNEALKECRKMGFEEDHLKVVGKRWAEKYRESGMDAKEFTKHMRSTMLSYGWTEEETERLIKIAVGKAAGS